MQNMSDNELDNLFKEAAEGFKPPQDDSAWKQMATLLDKNPVKAPLWNWKTVTGISTVGLLTITAVWYAATGDPQIISKTTKKHESNNATQGVVQEQEKPTHPTGKQNLPSTQSMEAKNYGIHALEKGEPKRGIDSAKKDETLRAIKPGQQGDKEIRLRDDKKQLTSEKSTSIIATENFQAVPPREGRTIVPVVENKLIVTTDSTQRAYTELKTDSAERISKNTDKKVTDRKEDETKPQRMVSVKAAVSPDFSSVNFFSAGKPGFNYGLLAGFVFNNRWSVYTGVIASKKMYATKDVEGVYNWGGHDYPMKELDGDCRIIDIPINVYYTFFPERSFSLRAGLGFSSYIMRKETYVYCVDNYGVDNYYEQQVNNKNKEWFKVMNLSVAISKKITNRWSVEFEPFVKAPLAGVGEGRVSLVSTGAFINLKYDLIILK